MYKIKIAVRKEFFLKKIGFKPRLKRFLIERMLSRRLRYSQVPQFLCDSRLRKTRESWHTVTKQTITPRHNPGNINFV